MNIVEKISKFWNKLKYWQKGGIIGFILGWLPFLYSFLPIKLKQWVLFFSPYTYVPSFSFDIWLYSLPIIGLVLGPIFGLIIDQADQRFSFSKFSNAKRFGAISFLVLTLLLLLIPLFFLYNILRLVISPIQEAGAAILLNLFLALVSLLLILILSLLFSLPVSLLGLPLDLFKKYKIRRLSIYLLYILILLLSSFILYSLFIQGLGEIIGILIPS